MDMTAEAIQKVLDISQPALHVVKDVNDIETSFSSKPLFQVKAEPPAEPPAVKVVTLAGFADLVRAWKADPDIAPELLEDWLIHIESEASVCLKRRLSDDWGRRQELIDARPVEFKKFAFGQWLDQEQFAIAVAALFADTPDKAYVLNMASVLTSDAASTSEDDGFTQRVNVKAGLKMKETVTLKPRVDLAPYRTFPEIPQPVSAFVFRARGGDTPALMLVEADGGRWKIEAIAELRKAVEAFDLGIPIVA